MGKIQLTLQINTKDKQCKASETELFPGRQQHPLKEEKLQSDNGWKSEPDLEGRFTVNIHCIELETTQKKYITAGD